MDGSVTGRRSWVEQIMSMPISLHLRGVDLADPVVEKAAAAVFAQLREVEQMFSTFRPSSQISAINAGRLRVEQADPLVRQVLVMCEEARQRTDGYFDINLPGPDGRIRIDPAGLVKGWAVERASAYLRGLPGRDFCLNAGGDMIIGGDPQLDERGAPVPWRIGIENPEEPTTLVTSLEVVSGGIATSGSTHRGKHILVPQSGKAASGLLSVTVTGPTLVWADVYATAAVARGRDALGWLSTLEDYAAMVVRPGGTALVTESWPV